MMNIFRFTMLAVSALGLMFSFVVRANVAERYGKQKVVYHVNYPGGKEDKKYRDALRNIQNHINAVGAEIMVFTPIVWS